MKKLVLLVLIALLPVQAGALGYYTNVLQDEQGNTLAAKTVTIYLADTVTLASLYSDNGTTPIANPLYSDYLGRFEFWAANGLYDVCVSGTGITPFCLENQKILDEGHVGLPAFNVTDPRFGAIAGDDLDDSAAFQACVDAIEDAGGGTMVVPPGGGFNIASTVTLCSDIKIVGGGTILSEISTNFLFRATEQENITVSGIAIDGASESSAYNGSGYPGILGAYGCSNVAVLDCHIYDSGADGVYFGPSGAVNGTSLSVTGCLIERARRDGIACTSGIGVNFIGNVIVDAYGQGVDFEPDVASSEVSNYTVSGNVIRSELTAVTVSSQWGQAIGINESAGVIGAGAITGNSISYLFPDEYLATAAASTNYCTTVIANTVSGPLVFTGNEITSNRLSDVEGNYGVVTMWAVGNLYYADNVLYRPETTPAVASGEGHAAWKGLAVLDCDGAVLRGTVRGAFNTPLWVNSSDNVEIDMHLENTSNSISANVTGAAFIRQCNVVRMTGYYSTPDNIIVFDAVDGVVLHGAVLKSSASGVCIRNQAAASGNVAAIGCMVNKSDAVAFPNTAMTQNNDGNAIATFCESATMDYTN